MDALACTRGQVHNDLVILRQPNVKKMKETRYKKTFLSEKGGGI